MPKKKSARHAEPVSPQDSDWKAAWETEDNYWFENFSSRPYALGPDWYDRFRPAFRYGFESAQHHMGRRWDEAEPDLRRAGRRYEHRGEQPSALGRDQGRRAGRVGPGRGATSGALSPARRHAGVG